MQSASAYTDEAYRRFKLRVLEDEETLSGTSDDRIREKFRAQLRTPQQFNENDWIRPPARNYAYLLLDEPTVSVLADLSFPNDMGIISPHNRSRSWMHGGKLKCPIEASDIARSLPLLDSTC